MASDLGKFLSADAAERGRQAHALTIHLLTRGAPATALDVLLTDLGAKDAAKIVKGAQEAIQRRRTRDHLGAVSPDCIAYAATLVGVSAGRVFTLHQGENIRLMPIPKALVANRFVVNSLAFTMGEPGIGKTFFCVSLAAHITTGASSWLGAQIPKDLRGRPVVYALAEGVGMFQLRVIGCLQHMAQSPHVTIPPSFLFLPQSIKVEDTASVEAFIKTVEPYDPCLVVVDTYQRHGGPETEEERVNKAIENLTLIKESLGCLVNGVHHLPKDGRQTPRGHGAIDGSIDTAVYLTREHSGDTAVRFEQRDLEPSTFYAATKKIEVDGYIDGDTGDPRTTLVFEQCSAKSAQRIQTGSKKQDELTKAIIASVTMTPGINQKQLCQDVGGKKTVAVAEINRLVSTGELKNSPVPGKGNQVVNHFHLRTVPF
jgi:hypothetical protein